MKTHLFAAIVLVASLLLLSACSKRVAPKVPPSFLSASEIETLPLTDAIKTVYGAGQRTIRVFSQPTCPACREQEAELEKLGNVTVYTFVLANESFASQRQAINAWCARDQSKAWHDTMRGVVIESENCDHAAISRNITLATDLRLLATPTLIFENGQMITGLTRAVTLAQILGRQAELSEK